MYIQQLKRVHTWEIKMARATTSVTKEAIADYWLNSKEMDWSLMFIEPEDACKRCWYCGRETSRLERCHIIPDSLGGKPEPSNLVLLCHSCHLEAPNVIYKEAMLDWLYTSWNKSFFGLYETHQIYNHLKYYEDTYKSSYLNDLNSVLLSIYLMFISINPWILLLLGIPAQIIILLGFKIKRYK